MTASPPRVLVLRAPGTNCDVESAFAFEAVGAKAERVHVNRLLEKPNLLEEFQILCFPGGFSYGDDIAAGRILGAQLKHRLAEPLARFHEAQKLILGICNGFQILARSGLLWRDEPLRGPQATLCWNASGRYMDRWVKLAVAKNNCVFLKGIESLELPVAHAEGQFVARDGVTWTEMEAAGLYPLRYTEDGSISAKPVPYPANPNGAMGNVAGVCDPTGRILGLMPHPERYIHGVQHPSWTRRPARDEGDGLAVFRNGVQYFN